MAAVSIMGLWGYIDKTGAIIIPDIYEKAGKFSDGLAPVRKNGLWGFINTSSKEVIPCIYGETKSFSEGVAAISRTPMEYGYSSIPPSGDWSYIDKTGKTVISGGYTDADPFINGLARVRLGKFGDPNPESVMGFKYSYINKKGEPTSPVIYPELTDFTNIGTIVKKNGKWSLTDNQGKTKVAFDKEIFEMRPFYEGLAAAKLRHDAWGYINTAGDVVIPPDYGGATDFSEGLAVVSSVMFVNKYFINRLGQRLTVTPPDIIWSFSEGIAPAAIKNPDTSKLMWGYYKNPLRK